MHTYFSFGRQRPELARGRRLAWARTSTLGLTLALASLCAFALAKPATSLPSKDALPASVSGALKQANVPLNALSVMVVPVQTAPNAATPPARLSHRANADMNPASVMKLITTSAGLSMLGPDFTWRNRVFTDGTVKDGVLYGNMYLKGSGDPKLVVERLQSLIDEIMQKGLRDIRGDIILDGSVFDLSARNPASFDDEPLRPYNVAPQGLLLNFNAMLFKFTPDVARGEAKIDSEPPLRNVQWSTSVPLSNAPCQDWRSQLKADFSNADHVRFAGAYPSACGEQKWPVAYVQPHTFAARMVQAMWLQAGGKLTGQTRDGLTPKRANFWLEATSLPLSEIVADINKFSNNVMAQQLFLTLSSQQGTGNFEASRALVLQWWRQNLKDQTLPVLENGSGLSREERSSAQALAALLQMGARSAYAQALQSSLAIAGVDGTVSRLKDRLPNSVAIGRAQLKSGSLRDVASLAGYVEGLSGQRYVFVVIVNHPNANAARPAMDKLLEWTVADQKKS
jgi:D-alanyl-D-alanine carboxypeptidase/D-alanyl-D-alanine-endopeptidase (penicillin-binding protein 4)